MGLILTFSTLRQALAARCPQSSYLLDEIHGRAGGSRSGRGRGRVAGRPQDGASMLGAECHRGRGLAVWAAFCPDSGAGQVTGLPLPLATQEEG